MLTELLTLLRLSVPAARPTETTITVLWSPPRNKNIRVRGYTIGWGRGVPDSYTEVIDAEMRHYVITELGQSLPGGGRGSDAGGGDWGSGQVGSLRWAGQDVQGLFVSGET